MKSEQIVYPVEAQARHNLLAKRLKKAIPIILERAPQASVSIFGSFARGELTPESDIDIYVDPNFTFPDDISRAVFKVKMQTDVCRLAGGDIDVSVPNPFSPDSDREFQERIAGDLIKIVNQGKIINEWR